MSSNPPQQSNNSQDSLIEVLIRHRTKLEELLTLLYSGENRSKIEKANIDTFEEDLRQIIEDLRSRRKENGILTFVSSVDEIVGIVSDIVDTLTLAGETFEPKRGGLKQRLQYFKDCRELLEDALDKFLPALKLPDIKTQPDTNEGACSA